MLFTPGGGRPPGRACRSMRGASAKRSDAGDDRHGVNPPGRADLAMGDVRGLDHSPTMAGGPFLAQNQISHVGTCTVNPNLL